MVTMEDVKYLSKLSGRELLDEAAKIVGAPIPSQLMSDLDTQNPEELERLAQGWASVKQQIGDHAATIESTTSRILQHWDGAAADSFSQYMNRLYTVTDKQWAEVKQIEEALNKAAEDMRNAKGQAMTAAGIAAGEIIVAVSVCLGLCIAAGWVWGAGVVAGLVELAAGIVITIGTLATGIHLANDTKNDALVQANKKIKIAHEKAERGELSISAVQLPPEPTITGKSFKDILDELNQKFYYRR